MAIVYVPLFGSVVASRKPPAAPNETGETSTVPFGFKSEILVVQQPPAITRLTTWPALPVKVRLAFWPGTVVVALIAALIAVGLPLLNGLVSADRPLAAGSTVEVDRGVTFTAAAGWSLDAEQTDTRIDRVALAQGPLSYVVEAAPATRSPAAGAGRG